MKTYIYIYMNDGINKLIPIYSIIQMYIAGDYLYIAGNKSETKYELSNVISWEFIDVIDFEEDL